jgi:hypothetical protein
MFSDIFNKICHNRTVHCNKQLLFDHLVGEREQPRRNCETERFGDLEIDHELKLGWLHDWQVGRLGAFENLASIDANLAPHLGNIDSITH